jgi:hypothetical protein
VPPVEEPPTEEPPVTEPSSEGPPQTQASEVNVAPPAPATAAEFPVVDPLAGQEAARPHEPEATEPASQEAAQRHTADIAGTPESLAAGPASPAPEPEAAESGPQEVAQRHTADIAGTPESLAAGPASPAAEEPEAAEPGPHEAAQRQTADIAGTPESLTAGPRPPAAGQGHWLLSLFTPAADDTVDWTRGNYTLLTRSGRVDASGELKKQLAMIAEGSVVFAPSAPRGSAPDVAPDGFAHPVFRAGFALSIPLPEVSG